MNSIAYSPDGQRIISGSDDNTIRIWDAVAGVAVGKPLKGHTKRVWSVAYSPDGRCICISGSGDMTVQIWDAMTGTEVRSPPEGYTSEMKSIDCSPDGHHIVSASSGDNAHVSGSLPHDSIPFSSPSNPINSIAYLQQDTNGWVTTQRVVYYIGYPQNAVQASIHLLS